MGRQETITLDKVLDFFDTGLPFNMVYVTADEKRGTGGDIVTLSQWIKCTKEALPSGILRRNKISHSSTTQVSDAENANRLIYNPQTQDIRAVHIRLICEFNGKRVI